MTIQASMFISHNINENTTHSALQQIKLTKYQENVVISFKRVLNIYVVLSKCIMLKNIL